MTEAGLFEDILGQDISNAQKPKALPVGTYRCQIAKWDLAIADTKNGKVPKLVVQLKVLEAGDDVDADLLAESLPESGLQFKSLKGDFFLDADSIWRVNDFLKAAKVETSGRPLKDALPEMVGLEIMAYTMHNPGKQGSDVTYNNVTRYLPIE